MNNGKNVNNNGSSASNNSISGGDVKNFADGAKNVLAGDNRNLSSGSSRRNSGGVSSPSRSGERASQPSGSSSKPISSNKNEGMSNVADDGKSGTGLGSGIKNAALNLGSKIPGLSPYAKALKSLNDSNRLRNRLSNNNNKNKNNSNSMMPKLPFMGNRRNDNDEGNKEGQNNSNNNIDDNAKNNNNNLDNQSNDDSSDDSGSSVSKFVVGQVAAVALSFLLPIIIVVILVVVAILLLVVFMSIFISIFSFDIINNNEDNQVSVNTSGTCTYKVGKESVSNVKVKLLNCEGNTYVPGEELIDFEDYIAGVVSQEVGDTEYEALKVQAIVARSFALTRPKEMGNAFGLSLKKNGDQWILSLRSCTNDQVFCNPNKGCWSLRNGGQTSDSNKADWPNCTVHSGDDSSKPWHRAPLPADSKIRKAVEDTKGQVVLNKNGNIFHTNFNNSNQQNWIKLAKSGKDAYEIIVSDYGKGKTLSTPNCSSSDGELASDGDYVAWMINFANDNSHGYSQANRQMNPDVDCSSFVYYGLVKGGGFKKSDLGNGPFSTSTMRSSLKKAGFKEHKYDKDSLKKGDVLWRSGHTEVYIGGGKTVGAHTDKDGRKGDSSGKEVDVSGNSGRWSYYYRYGS